MGLIYCGRDQNIFTEVASYDCSILLFYGRVVLPCVCNKSWYQVNINCARLQRNNRLGTAGCTSVGSAYARLARPYYLITIVPSDTLLSMRAFYSDRFVFVITYLCGFYVNLIYSDNANYMSWKNILNGLIVSNSLKISWLFYSYISNYIQNSTLKCYCYIACHPTVLLSSGLLGNTALIIQSEAQRVG